MPKDVKETPFGRYSIRSANVSGRWQARAYVGGKVAGEVVTAETREAAIDGAESMLPGENDQWPQPSTWFPTADQFCRAFAVLGPLPKYQQDMLRAHVQAPDQIMTATQLANAAGYHSYSSANSLYGKLGRRLAEILSWIPEKRADGTPIWTSALASDADETEKGHWQTRHYDGEHFRWRLRPEVAEAVRR